ncbi:MAG TPA: DUF2085 domain-containing protein [Myxococcaceae bacterium]|nr:DUF2085 domain-containing protein [Myxococcaceae bacterium]
MFWLSHHHADELDRTYAFGSVHVCARCLGTYPVLLVALFWQIKTRAPTAWAYDGPWAIGLLLPALADWAYGRFRPHAFGNLWRSFTGVLLGLGLGRTLFIHFLKPLPLWLLAQGALVLAVAVPVLLLSARRRRE